MRRYAGNLWRTSPDAPTGTSKDPFNDAMNEARVVFAGHKEIFESIQNIMTLDYYDYRQHDPILKMMAKEAGLSTKHWPDRAFEKVIV
ncbi:MAG: hypothetical protein OXG05_08315 [Gammaproteobacteria bacterium]|nr:hypothetical protein [Gammaproteobacteria bacterium]